VTFKKTDGFRNSSDGRYAVAGLIEQSDKLVAKLDLSVDD